MADPTKQEQNDGSSILNFPAGIVVGYLLRRHPPFEAQPPAIIQGRRPKQEYTLAINEFMAMINLSPYSSNFALWYLLNVVPVLWTLHKTIVALPSAFRAAGWFKDNAGEAFIWPAVNAICATAHNMDIPQTMDGYYWENGLPQQSMNTQASEIRQWLSDYYARIGRSVPSEGTDAASLSLYNDFFEQRNLAFNDYITQYVQQIDYAGKNYTKAEAMLNSYGLESDTLFTLLNAGTSGSRLTDANCVSVITGNPHGGLLLQVCRDYVPMHAYRHSNAPSSSDLESDAFFSGFKSTQVNGLYPEDAVFAALNDAYVKAGYVQPQF